jgi:hypothetical protein
VNALGLPKILMLSMRAKRLRRFANAYFELLLCSEKHNASSADQKSVEIKSGDPERNHSVNNFRRLRKRTKLARLMLRKCEENLSAQFPALPRPTGEASWIAVNS